MSQNTTPYDPTSIEYLARIIDRAKAGYRVSRNVSRAQFSLDLVCLYQEIFATTEPPEQHDTTLWDIAEEETPMPSRCVAFASITTGKRDCRGNWGFVAAPGILPLLVEDLDANEVDRLGGKMKSLAQRFSDQNLMNYWSELIAKVSIAPAQLSIELGITAFADYLEIPSERILSDALSISAKFQLRRKGVETKIILGNTPPEVDQTLIRNIANAIKSSKTFKKSLREPEHRNDAFKI